MRASFDPLPALRRRARAVLAPVLALLTVGWLGAAGPCVGMAAAAAGPVEREPRSDAHAGHGADTHAGANARAGDAVPARHGGSRHASSADSAAGSAHTHGACPHCPGSSGATPAEHSHCAALDDVSSAKREPHGGPADPKPALACAALAAPAPKHDAGFARRSDSHHRVFPPPVPLHLRHCVLIV